jgi:Serine carboxypeptidase
MVDGIEYGAVRQYGNFSFLRIYQAGHLVSKYQPKASLEFFRRVLYHKVIANGMEDVVSAASAAPPIHGPPCLMDNWLTAGILLLFWFC